MDRTETMEHTATMELMETMDPTATMECMGVMDSTALLRRNVLISVRTNASAKTRPITVMVLFGGDSTNPETNHSEQQPTQPNPSQQHGSHKTELIGRRVSVMMNIIVCSLPSGVSNHKSVSIPGTINVTQTPQFEK
mmetsp:Transcript_12025/g.34460  ORF Transcript_12025/g.34460 Transcript_12025/m.34460 type:complete len:137 (+) Transcript_12025:1643-2053(+)